MIRNFENPAKEGVRAINIFGLQEVKLSAIVSPSNFLLLSQGSKEAVKALAQCCQRKEWNFSGVSGPKDLAKQFVSLRECEAMEKMRTPREFRLFETSSQKMPASCGDNLLQLCRVESNDWPRARVWAQQFAAEAEPSMDLGAITQMAKNMYQENNLYLLKNEEKIPCAMAGFGRSTDRYQVINMVYVPVAFRHKGIARNLIKKMIPLSHSMGFHGCLLFSDWSGKKNLYQSMGFRELGRFIEYDLV